MFRKGKTKDGSKSSPEVKGDTVVAKSPLMALKLPDEGLTLGDKVAEHKGQDTPFMYATIFGEAKEGRMARLDRIISGRPKLRTHENKLKDLPVIDLVKHEVDLPLQSVFMGRIGPKFPAKYICVNEVTFCYSPTISFYDRYSTVMFALKDGRKVVDKISRSVSANSNVSLVGCFSMDHFVHQNDIKHLSFFVELNNSQLEAGTVWGSLQIGLTLSFSDASFPVKMEDTLAVVEFPDTAMRKLRSNPTKVDVTYDQDDVEAMQDLFKKGKIVDRTTPANRRSAAVFSKSEAGGSVVSYEENPDMSAVKSYLNSAPDLETGFKAAKKAIKKNRSPPPSKPDSEDLPNEGDNSVSRSVVGNSIIDHETGDVYSITSEDRYNQRSLEISASKRFEEIKETPSGGSAITSALKGSSSVNKIGAGVRWIPTDTD